METKTLKRSVLSLMALLILFPSICLAADTIRINGSGSALDLMKPMITAFKRSHQEAQIFMEKPLGSSGAIKALLAGELDLVIGSKPLKPEEIAKGAQLQLYGKTPLVIIAHKGVPATNITTKELEAIFSAKTTQWANGERIRLIMRPRQDVDSSILSSLSPAIATAMQSAYTRQGMIIAVTDPEAYKTVCSTPGAVGASGMVSIVTENLQLKSLSLNGVKASIETIANGRYPIYKQISLITLPTKNKATQQFIDFLLSPQGRRIAQRNGVLVTAEGR